MRHTLIFSTTLLLTPVALCAQGSGAKLRELSTDRPDATESPFTVDAGHVQLEMHGLGFTRDKADGVTTTEWDVAPFNLRFGLTPDLEAGVFFSPHLRTEEKPRTGPATTLRGIGDTVLRLKKNFWGNDGGPTAGGVFVDVKIPTAAAGLGNDKWEAAIVFPVAYDVGGGWEGAAMTRVERRFVASGRYRAAWVNTITFAHDLTEKSGGFLELTSDTGDGPHAATFNLGVTYKTDANTQFDAGVNLGISRAAPDLGLFVGLSRRY
ncbi:MAG: transporter [Verrucomicrobia bacterium]|nr:transporter [Verrucomicrobiota bacterium]